MRRTRPVELLFAVAALALPVLAPVEPAPEVQVAAAACGAGACQAAGLEMVFAVPGPPLLALLAAGLALGLARGKEGVRRPVRRRRG